MSDNLVKFTPAMLSVLAGENKITLPFQKDIFLIEIQVAGTSFRKNIKELEPLLEPGQMYRMVREPENQYDANAIAIYFDEEKMGYIPAEQNEIIARLMDVGKFFYCKLISKEWIHNWLRLKTEVYMKD
ncbi:MAG: HIRAN domain-containing protein [Bacteroidota bacterium]|nr:HIRAN domain-containing protein [Bacteroidota bacterium]